MDLIVYRYGDIKLRKIGWTVSCMVRSNIFFLKVMTYELTGYAVNTGKV